MYPLVSVLTTSYNRENFIIEAIESVLSSSYTNIELIISDDASKDNTVAVAKSIEIKDKRVHVHVNEKNLGDYPNRNKAASYAKGEFLMFVDSDDMILKDGIEKCVNAMRSFPRSNFGMYSFNKETAPYEIDSKKAIKKHFFEKPFLITGPGGTIIRRSFFEEIKGYPEKYGPANDMYFSLKAACFSPVVMLPFEFMFYRRHEGQEINNSYSYLTNNYIYLKDAIIELPLQLSHTQLEFLRNKNRRRFFVNIIKYFFKSGNFKKTVTALKATSFHFKDSFKAVFH